MKTTAIISLIIKAAVAVAVAIVSVSILFGQEKIKDKEKFKDFKVKEFCSSNSWSDANTVSFKDLREMTVPAGGSLAVDGGRNGGVRVTGENRSDILIRACVQGWGTSEEAARSVAQGIRISTSPVVKAESSDESSWSVSYEIRVPNSTNLKLNAHNGGISIASVEGSLEFETTNGGVSLVDVAGDVRGRTTNGGVNVALSGNSWRGNGLDVTTTNGGVHLLMPQTYAANIETGTTNGGFKSDIPALNVSQEDHKGDSWRSRAKRLNLALNGGGAPIRVMTTNGGVKISSADGPAL